MRRRGFIASILGLLSLRRSNSPPKMETTTAFRARTPQTLIDGLHTTSTVTIEYICFEDENGDPQFIPKEGGT